MVLHPHGIALTFLKIGFVVAGGGLYSYYIHQGNKSDKGIKIVNVLQDCNSFKKENNLAYFYSNLENGVR